MPEEPEEFEEFDIPPPFLDGEMPQITEPGEPIEVVVEGVFLAENKQDVQRFVLLSDGDRKLPIQIGAPEAAAINYCLDGVQPDRPMTHELLRTVIERLEGKVVRVVIDDIWKSTYYAKLYIKPSGKDPEMEIDCRPSDAIALALKFEAPIYVCENVLVQGAS